MRTKLYVTDEQKSELIELLLKIKDLNLDVDTLIDQAKSIYDKLSEMGFDSSVKEGIGGKISVFFSELIASIKNFFSSLFS